MLYNVDEYLYSIIAGNFSTRSSSSMALQPGVRLGLLYNTPPSLSIPCSVSPFVYSHLSQVRGHFIQPSHFWSSSSSCCIQFSVHFFLNCGVLHRISTRSLARNTHSAVCDYMPVSVCVRECEKGSFNNNATRQTMYI